MGCLLWVIWQKTDWVTLRLHCMYHRSAPWTLFQYKDHICRYGDFHYKYKTATRLSYLYNGNSHNGKRASILNQSPSAPETAAFHMCWKLINVSHLTSYFLHINNTNGTQGSIMGTSYNKSFQWGSNIRPRPSSFEIGQFGSFCDFIYVGVKAEDLCATGEVWVNR